MNVKVYSRHSLVTFSPWMLPHKAKQRSSKTCRHLNWLETGVIRFPFLSLPLTGKSFKHYPLPAFIKKIFCSVPKIQKMPSAVRVRDGASYFLLLSYIQKSCRRVYPWHDLSLSLFCPCPNYWHRTILS